MKPFSATVSSLLLVCALASGIAHAAVVTKFVPRNQPTGWVGEVEVTNFNFSSDLEVMFKTDFERANWTGNLYAFPVLADGSLLFDADQWSGGAASQLKDQDWNTGRVIFTMKEDGTKIPFRWLSLSSGQRSDLGGKEQRLNYIRGSRADETPLGEKYRLRVPAAGPVLGDIIHSRPLYVYHPTDPLVIVGANDGMLHAFDADTGAEVWAYVPSMLLVPLREFTNDPYIHQYYVDGTPNARAVTLSTGAKTVLVGGLGAGGKGLFALDITDPTATEITGPNKIMWEITNTTINNVNNTAYENLGYTYGVPLIVKANNNKWVAIVGNGYVNGKTNQAVLYVIDLETGTKTAGIATTVAGVSDDNPNGLSSPSAIDTTGDGVIDYVYAGDMFGNVWKFDLTSATPASWSATKLFTTSPAQPITGRIAPSLHPYGGYMLSFGTGRIFDSADAISTATHYVYGIWDNARVTGFTLDAAKLVAQTLAEKSYSGGGVTARVRVSSSNAVDYAAGAGQKHGWKLALPAGERVVGDGGFSANGRYIFSSYNPTIDNGVGRPRGENWLQEVDYSTGGGFTTPIFDLDNSFLLDNGDRVVGSGGTAQLGPTGTPIARFISMGVMSPPIEAQLTSMSQTYFNTNPDYLAPAVTTSDPGVSGGHFDFDIYTTRTTHVHEYDDKYNVTGVNMLAPSLAAFNLANAIPSTATRFRILVANQKLSPAAVLHVGGNDGVEITDFQTTAGLTVASLPVYTRAAGTTAPSLQSLMLALPLNAFASQDWAGTNDVRAGVMPTTTGCVHSNRGAATGGPWMNGALTIQVIKEHTPQSAIQENIIGDPTYGYRLKADATSQSYRLAQYTLFWHHPNGKCLGDAAWVASPPQDFTGSSKSSTRAPGSADPQAGAFGSAGSVGTGGGTGGGGSPGGTSTTVTYTMTDGTVVTQTTTRNTDGTYTVTRVSSNGTTTSYTIPPTSAGRESDVRARTGRLSWRELIRP